jgi:putative transposase
MVKVREDHSVRTRACYLAIGVILEGEREVLGICWQDTEGAKFWLAVLNDLHHRGVQDILVCCIDGLTGFPEAIAAVFPQAWVHPPKSLQFAVQYLPSAQASATSALPTAFWRNDRALG